MIALFIALPALLAFVVGGFLTRHQLLGTAMAMLLGLGSWVFGAVGTSPLGADVTVAGLLLQCSNSGSSPDSFFTVCNVSSFQLPLSAKTVDVTNVSNQWEAMVPTLKTFGKIQLKIFWVMEEATHRNNAGGGATATGLRYLYLAYPPILRDWQVIYPDGNNSTDAFSAYVTSFSIDAKVANVFEATIELTANTQNPSFV